LNLPNLVPTESFIQTVKKQCGNLVELTLNVMEISDKLLETTLANFQLLQKLELLEARQLTVNGMKSITKLPALKKLKVSQGDSLVNNDIIEAFSTGCMNQLTFLDISQRLPIKFNDDTLGAIAKSCCNLEVLCLLSWTLLTDYGMEKLANNCKRLRKLYLERCPHITCLGIRNVVKYCKSLVHITLPEVGVCDKYYQTLFSVPKPYEYRERYLLGYQAHQGAKLDFCGGENVEKIVLENLTHYKQRKRNKDHNTSTAYKRKRKSS